MNKKIGLLTLPLKDNYGGILQALALYTQLERMGCEVTLIRKEVFYPFWKKVLVLALQWLPFQNYKNFRSTRINSKIHKPIIDSIITRKTDVAITRSDLERMAFEYKFDAVVVGSDQVWRPQYTDRIYYGAYFLDFLGEGQTRRISYAASFGLDYWSYPDKENEVRSLLSKFDALSSREMSGVKLCADFGRSDCAHVVDPTLLVGKEFYKSLMGKTSLATDKSVLCYILDDCGLKRNIVSSCMSSLGHGYAPRYIYSGGNGRQSYSIPEWLRAFSDAEYVITDSFHGVVFSIVFNKKFVAISNPERGAGRFDSLLSRLELRERLISIGSGADVTRDASMLIGKEIDYDRVNALLDDWRLSSNKFLNEALNG